MVIKIKHFFPTLFAIILLIAAVVSVMNINRKNEEKGTVNNTSEQQEQLISSQETLSQTTAPAVNTNSTGKVSIGSEFKGLWVTYISLDMKSTDYSEESFKNKFDEIIKTSKENHFNALIVHVRPFADALYKSEIFPWSHIVSGQQGKDPGFDPLSYMVDATHRANMQFHAWINPYRIQLDAIPPQLAPNNLYNVWRQDNDVDNDDYVIDLGNEKYLNPAYLEVQSNIISGVKEIAQNYNIDGIQFDDYFYPSNADENFDKKAYENYLSKIDDKSTALTLEEWRQNNVTSLISGTYRAIKSINKDIIFGISPQCNVQNDLKMGANVYEWGSSDGLVDYICPQFYISFTHPVLPFEKSVQEWKNIVKNPNISLYYGLAVYKAGSDADGGTWKDSNDILKRQVEYGRKNGCNGFIFYSYDQIKSDQAKQEMDNLNSII